MAKKMLKKILTLGVMVIMAFGLFAGCGGDKGIWFFVNPEHGFSADGLDEEPTILKLVRSLDELQQLCNETGITYDGEKYDEAFFVDKAIIICAYWFDPHKTYELNKIQISDNKIVIHTTIYTQKGMNYPAVSSHAFGCYEVNKADLLNATEIQINTKNKTK